jgi:hypothetical protein
MIPAWIWAIAVAVLVIGAIYGVRNQINGMTNAGSVRPKLWWVVDDSQVNARQWLDWNARSTRDPNEPYLQICKEKAERLWSAEFDIEPLVGRLAVIRKLEEASVSIPEGADRCPPTLWLPWCRAIMLKQFGGLWVDGSVLPMATGAEVRARVMNADVLMFGSDPDEGLSAEEEGTPAAGRNAGWAAMPGHPMWSGLERDLGALIAAGDQSWSSADARRSQRFAWDRHCSGVTRVDRAAEVSRDRYGRRLELATLLDDSEWPTGSTEDALWVPLPDGRDGLDRSPTHLWFTRLSKEQMQESPFLWARWARQA